MKKIIISLITITTILTANIELKEIKEIGIDNNIVKNGIAIGIDNKNELLRSDSIKFYSCVDGIGNKELKSNEYKIIYVNNNIKSWYRNFNQIGKTEEEIKENIIYQSEPEYKILIHKEYLEKCNNIIMKYNNKEYQLDNERLVDYIDGNAIKINIDSFNTNEI